MKFFFKRLLVYFNFSVKKKINNNYFKVPILSGLGVSNLFLQELWMIELLGRIVNIGVVKFVDIGANIGQTLLKVKSVDREIEYIGFEPNQNCIYYLRKLINKNLFKNVILIPVGISTETTLEELNFYSVSDTDPSASIIKDFRKTSVVKKEYISLFNVIDLKTIINFNETSIIKIDVEGSELEVLESFFEIIKKNNPLILIEILPIYSEKQNPNRLKRQNKIEEILKDLKYSIFRINKSKNKLLGITQVDDIGIHSNLNHCDYIFVPSTKRSKFSGCFKS
ncbi:FkbM family methyltransferase [Thalassobellus sediminis]|uniref:FkbM family methyltransferase n=1 Tax=Thalassobellus sediminis TaxID=3367753 RepID=UPI003791A5D2